VLIRNKNWTTRDFYYGYHGIKMRCVKKCTFIHISTTPFLDDVERHNKGNNFDEVL
jgi:hypothetical protein